MVTSLDAVSILWCGMEKEGSRFLTYLERLYMVKLGWQLSVDRVPYGMRVSVALESCSLFCALVELLWKRLEKDAKAMFRGVELDIRGQRRWWWTVADPVSAIRVLASFVGVTCSDAEARLVWIGL